MRRCDPILDGGLFSRKPAIRRDAPKTSRAAAQAVERSVVSQRARVLSYIQSRGAEGATDAEVADALGLLMSSATARRNGLVKEGSVVDSGRRRSFRVHRSGIVWTGANLAAGACQKDKVCSDERNGPGAERALREW